ncbi:glycosyltransferase family 1 protein [Marinilabiliaceae bacterium JC017]|nr:glycosyltransferase family 1 protein [Marinilabiliaceae bacterium JC017]
MLKICFCNTMKSWGGGEKWHYEMAKALSERGYDVHFILTLGSEIDKRIKENKIIPHYLKVANLSFLDPFKHKKLVTFFRNQGFDALLVNNPTELKLVAPAAKRAGIKKIIYRRGSDVVVKKKILNQIVFEKIVTDIIANSNATRSSLLYSGMNIADKITVINNGIHPPKESGSQQVLTDNQTIIIGAVGRLSKEKGFHHLISIAKILTDNGKDFKIKIAGRGGQRSELEKQISENGLHGKVELVGFINNVYDFLGNCDIFALPSRYEGFGYVMVEAMFTKKPIVAFEISAAKEIVIHGQTGLLAKPFDLNDFANHLMTLMDNKNLCRKFGLQGEKKAYENYLFDKSVDKILKLITN